MHQTLISTCTLILLATSANALCLPPSLHDTAPSIPLFISAPSKPHCMIGFEYAKTHTCDPWEVENYIREAKNYIEELENYHNRAVNFANKAIDYANRVRSYAECESERIAG